MNDDAADEITVDVSVNTDQMEDQLRQIGDVFYMAAEQLGGDGTDE